MTQFVAEAPTRRPPARRRSRWLVPGGVVGAALAALAIMTLWLKPHAQTSPSGALDAPTEGALVTDPTEVYGWAIDQGATDAQGTGVDHVRLYLDGTLLADTQYGATRADIAAAFGPHFGASGWSASLDPRGLAAGLHTLQAQAHSTVSDATTTYDRTILVKPASSPQGAVDVPAEGAVLSQATEVRGWAIDQLASAGSTGVDRVQLFLDDQALVEGTYGAQRSDVAASFGDQFGASGWSATLDPTGRAAGRHTLEVRAHSVVSGDDAPYRRVIVFQAPTAPRGSLDEPAEAAAVHGIVEVRGWAIDEAAPTDTGVDRVSLYLDGQHVADAETGQSRPEIGAAYGERFGNCGWHASVDLSSAPAGPHTLEARAHSTASGQETTYSHSIVAAP